MHHCTTAPPPSTLSPNRTDYHNYGLWRPRVVFTIHNLNYGAPKVGEAAYYCQKLTTVSPAYAGEVAGHPAVAAHAHK